jgi:hypothetical protein
MALVNPNIAMSFRQPEFTPRNALAEYAQIQQIQGGQRQAEVADMQLRRMRQEDEDIERIHQIAMKNGGPDSRMEMGRALFASRNPTQRELGYKILQHEEAVRAYNSEFGPGAMAAPTMPKSAPGTMAMPSTPAPRTERGVDAYGKPFDAEVGGGIAPPGAMGQPLAPLDAPASANEPYPGYNASIGMPTPSANALAPTPTPSANALAPAPAAPNIDALRRQYGMAVAAGRSDAPVLLKQIEAALRGEQNKPLAVSRGQVVIDPRTGQQIFAAPEAPASLSDRFVPVGRLVFDRQTQQYISPSQAQLAQSQERSAAGAAAGGAGAGAAPAAPAGKPPTSAQVAKDKRMEDARQAIAKDIETQLGYYQELAGIGAMTSPKRSAGANVIAYARSSGLGQEFERATGTSAQTLRDNIKNTRQRLFMQIKDATGATASQMNSNMEMQAWLNSMTDPQQSIETVQETLKQLDSVIAGVRSQVEQEQAGKKSPAKSAPAAPAAPAKAGPSVSNW